MLLFCFCSGEFIRQPTDQMAALSRLYIKLVHHPFSGSLELGGNLMYKSGSRLDFDDELEAPQVAGGWAASCLKDD